MKKDIKDFFSQNNASLSRRVFTKAGTDPFDMFLWTKRDVEIKNDTTNEVVFSGKDLEFPSAWSTTACQIVGEKYFRVVKQPDGSKVRETSVKQMVSRVVDTIVKWGHRFDYFGEHRIDDKVFSDELKYMLVAQQFSFNSPVWFNIGTTGGELGKEAASACFLGHFPNDDMESILENTKIEGMVFKSGSGYGINYSTLRGACEKISNGGTSSGVVPFMIKDDFNAGAIKSAGSCLGADQLVLTNEGPKTVKSLSEAESRFVCFSYDPPSNRYKAKWATAFKSGDKDVFEVKTDKGIFYLTGDHKVRMKTGKVLAVSELQSGMSVQAFSINEVKDGYLRCGLHDGDKSKIALHRLIAVDLLNNGDMNCIVHHKDENKKNNSIDNLQVLASQGEHSYIHGKRGAQEGTHVFVKKAFPKVGDKNPMHRTARFWKDPIKSRMLREKQSAILKNSGRALAMQKESVKFRMLNKAYEVLNLGGSIDTFEEYAKGRERLVAKLDSKKRLYSDIISNFGTYDSFVKEVREHNHKIISISLRGKEPVYDVEVECPTADDKSPHSGHNFVIWSNDNPSSSVGSGIVVFNTRRAARMVILDVDHPDIEEFIESKQIGEKAANALIKEGFSSDFRDRWGAYAMVPLQNGNQSINVTDAFLRAVEDDADWQLIGRVDGKPTKTLKARELWDKICNAAWKCGDPGVVFIDTVNREHQTPNTDKVYTSNPCLPAEAVVLTPEGNKTLGDLSVGDFVWDGFKFVEVLKKWSSGVKKIYKYSTTNENVFFIGTDNHRVMSNGVLVEVKEASFLDCIVGGFRKSIPISKTEFVREDEVFDITVGSAEHLFIANGAQVSNCSEFFHVPWASCNLASINILAARDRLKEIVPFITTAMNILIDGAGFPHKNFEKATHAVRPIGIGFTNIGAYLMVNGRAYDSQEGRYIVESLYRILNVAALTQSCFLAYIHGPFPEFDKNRNETLDRLLFRYKDKESLLVAAAAEYGLRNSQLTNQAPVGCLIPGSLVYTDSGIRRIERIGDVNGEQWQNISLKINSGDALNASTKFFVNDPGNTVSVKTFYGYELTGSAKHKIKVLNKNGIIEWKRLPEVTKDYLIPILLGSGASTKNPKEVALAMPSVVDKHFNCKEVHFPTHMTKELAELVGYFMGNGSLHEKSIRFSCDKKDEKEILEWVTTLVSSVFSSTLEVHTTKSRDTVADICVNSTILVDWWKHNDFAKRKTQDGKLVPHIPNSVLETDNEQIYCSFVRGVFTADGFPGKREKESTSPSMSSSKLSFIKDMQSIMLFLGFPSILRLSHLGGKSGLPVYELRIAGVSFCREFKEKIGFSLKRKHDAIKIEVSPKNYGGKFRVILSSKEKEALLRAIPIKTELRDVFLRDMRANPMMVRNKTLKDIISTYTIQDDVRKSLEYKLLFFFDSVASVETNEGSHKTYDISVPNGNTYIANGFVSHNTISFMMDAATTGIEPELSLVKYKKLVGGNTIKIVNPMVRAALEYIDKFDEDQINDIEEYILKNNSIVNAPHFKQYQTDWKDVFDTSFPEPVSNRSISAEAHVDMMAAAQRHVSSAISKTCNLPNSATPEDIGKLYMRAWKSGVKSIAVYRDGCKSSQPLEAGKKDAPKKQEEPKLDKLSVNEFLSESELSRLPGRQGVPQRKKLPDDCMSIRHKFTIGGHEGYLHVGMFADGSPGELFISMSKEGSTVSGMMDAFGIVTSMALQYGVPLAALVDKFSHTKFEPAGMTGSPDVRFASSVIDYIFRWLEVKFIKSDNNPASGLGAVQPVKQEVTKEDKPISLGEICTICGGMMVRTGKCNSCTNCGVTGGCG